MNALLLTMSPVVAAPAVAPAAAAKPAETPAFNEDDI